MDHVICPFCGRPEQLDLLEFWPADRTFLLETCCEDLQEAINLGLNDDPQWATRLLRHLGVEEIAGHRLRRLTDNGCGGMILDWQLVIRDIAFAAAKNFIDKHHEHCGPPVTWRFGASVWNGSTMIGVATVGNPVARGLCHRGTLEVNRLCIRRDIPSALNWNAASMLYGWCAREAARRGWAHIVSYIREDEDGTSLQAAGWTKEATVRGRGWHSNRRNRSNRNAYINKTRWGRSLNKRHPPKHLTNPVNMADRPGDPFIELFAGMPDGHEPMPEPRRGF